MYKYKIGGAVYPALLAYWLSRMPIRGSVGAGRANGEAGVASGGREDAEPPALGGRESMKGLDLGLLPGLICKGPPELCSALKGENALAGASACAEEVAPEPLICIFSKLFSSSAGFTCMFERELAREIERGLGMADEEGKEVAGEETELLAIRGAVNPPYVGELLYTEEEAVEEMGEGAKGACVAAATGVVGAEAACVWCGSEGEPSCCCACCACACA